jgi:prevent-host-death family protein
VVRGVPASREADDLDICYERSRPPWGRSMHTYAKTSAADEPLDESRLARATAVFFKLTTRYGWLDLLPISNGTMLHCSTMQRIGVRELRQQASRYLKRVAAGEAFEVTDNGRPVARLVPLPSDPWQALIESGQVIPAEQPGALLDVEPRDFGIDASGELSAMRALEDR